MHAVAVVGACMYVFVQRCLLGAQKHGSNGALRSSATAKQRSSCGCGEYQMRIMCACLTCLAATGMRINRYASLSVIRQATAAAGRAASPD